MKNASQKRIDIGLSKEARRELADGLSRMLADTYALYLKTQNFHWNVTGPTFHTLHAMFEEQYKALALAADEIAERIRALGFAAPGSFSAFSELTSLKEEKGVLDANDMVCKLLKDHETVIHLAGSILSLAEQAKDAPTVDLLTGRMEYHEKTAWMLRSSLK